MDRPTWHWRQFSFLFVLMLLPAYLIGHRYQSEHGFLSLIYFGSDYLPTSFPEVRELSVPAKTPKGYDGQYYAQIALDPMLQRAELPLALGSPTYRARRIALSWMAYLFGLGQPAWILQAYALLNVLFWLLLVGLLVRFIGLTSPRDYLLCLAIGWSAGALVSLTRALTDLPAVALSLAALFVVERRGLAAGFLGLAALVKETSILSLPCVAWPKPGKSFISRDVIFSVLVATVPIVVWAGFVQWHFSGGLNSGGSEQNFTWPILGLAQKWLTEVSRLREGLNQRSVFLIGVAGLEILASVAVFVQIVYLLAKPRLSEPAWRFGIAFAVLALTLGGDVWVEGIAYCRALLPLTISFNLLIHQFEKGRAYGVWLILGNLSLLLIRIFR